MVLTHIYNMTTTNILYTIGVTETVICAYHKNRHRPQPGCRSLKRSFFFIFSIVIFNAKGKTTDKLRKTPKIINYY